MTPAEERCRQIAKEEAPQRERLSILDWANEPKESETDMALEKVTPIAPKTGTGIAMSGVPQDILRCCPPLVRNALAKMDVAHQDEFAQEYQRKSKSVLKAYLFWSFGCHYLYLNRMSTQVAYWWTVGGALCWWFIDIFRMPGMVAQFNRDQAVEICRNVGLIQ
jgi:hypothetical protein